MRLFLIQAGEKRINVIREIRSFTGSSLKDAKDMSEQTNVLLFDGPGKIGRRFAAALTAQGAIIETSSGLRLSIANIMRTVADWIEG